MPTNRRFRRRNQRRLMTAAEAALLRDQALPADTPPGERLELLFGRGPQRLADLWAEHRDELLAEWAEQHPGTRPSAWWANDAPRSPVGTYPGAYYDGALPEPRRRLGGTGTPSHEVLAYVPHFEFGIPVNWVSAADVATYRDGVRAVDGRLVLIGDGRFDGVAIDPDDPPVYEAQASYLERHGLLLPGERARLRKADFAPVAVELVDDADEGDDLVDEPAA